MVAARNASHPLSHGSRWVATALLAAGLAWAGAAQADPALHKRHQTTGVHTADARPLTVYRHGPRIISGEAIVASDGFYDGTGLFRRWDDPRLYSFYGWRLGGDNFYGDQAGDPITRGNASLGAIAGYGPANGGYGGPHFDSVGGFHNGPGPGAQEAADYATGSISTPHYDRPEPRYPSAKQQVAALDSGLTGPGQVSRVKSLRERSFEVQRARFEQERDDLEDVAPATAPAPEHEDLFDLGDF